MRCPKQLFALGVYLLTAMSITAQTNVPQTTQTQVPSATVPLFTPMDYSGPLNYVRTWEPLGPYTDPNAVISAPSQNVRLTTQYLDGLGRPIQTVQRQASTTAKDIVAAVYYDQFGREAHRFLPYADVSGTGNGVFKTSPFTAQQSFYQGAKDAGGQSMYPGEQVFYAQSVFEPSPLNRVEKALAPGNSWAGSDKGVEQQYLINTPEDNVRLWSITYNVLTYTNEDVATNIPVNGSVLCAGVASGAYCAGELYKNATKDEAGNVVVEYKDKEGRVILKKVQIGSVTQDYSGYEGWLSTYYIYDDLGQLRFVLPPKAVEAIKGDWIIAGKTDVINELCFRYEYDHRGRMTAKKVPGAGWVYMVYDARDRLVFTQDANLRGNKQWMATLYDALNRPVVTGIMTYDVAPSVLQNNVSSWTASPITPNTTLQEDLVLSSAGTTGVNRALRSITMIEGFESATSQEFSAEIDPGPGGSDGETTVVEGLLINKNPLPQGASFVALTKTYYDSYAWTQKSYATAYTDEVSAGTNPHMVALPAQANTSVKGLVTGSKVRVLEDPNNLGAGRWMEAVSFFDDKGREIQTHSENSAGDVDVVTSLYDFSGKVLSTYLVHNNPKAQATAQTRVRTDYTYDHGGRVLEVSKMLNDDGKKVLIAKNTYDELGQLVQKKLGRKKDLNGAYTAEPLEKLDYTYNVRGWMKGVNSGYAKGESAQNDRYFGMDLSYDWGFDKNQLNGNISGVKWRSKGDGEQRAYGFGYDAANRLLYGDFNQNNGGWNKSAGVDFTVGGSTTSDPLTNGKMKYDANGNILEMWQKGLKLGQSDWVDKMSYAYYKNNQSNKLYSVSDAITADNKLGDFTDKNTSGADYGYDKNGNLTTDLNKKLNGVTEVDLTSGGAITYNHLNLPCRIQVKKEDGTDKGTITYVYDAVGNKQKKVTVEEKATVRYKDVDHLTTITTTTTYAGGFVYESKQYTNTSLAALAYTDQLQFLGHEEGRIRFKPAQGAASQSFAFDYFIKDHLGNVRMVLTEQGEPAAVYQASMEEATRSVDNVLFSGISETAAPKPEGFDTDGANQKVSKLFASSVQDKRVGPGVVLKVMAGDKFTARALGWYLPNSTDVSEETGLTPIVNSLVSALSGGLPLQNIHETGGAGSTSTGINHSLEDFLDEQGSRFTSSAAAPKAYLNWMVLDEAQFKLVQDNFGAVQMPLLQGTEPKQVLAAAGGVPIEVKKNGYLYVYLSNESKGSVYFDDLRVEHTRGPLLEETHYYPFGLTMAGISSKAAGSLVNRKKYNGIEHTTDLDLNQYDAFYRNLDPQTGRWWEIDPKVDSFFAWSPFNLNFDDPIKFSDPLGDNPIVRKLAKKE